jgi:molybdopterin-binding protein
MSIKASNARNQFLGRTVEVIVGSAVSEVDVQTPVGIVTSVVTTRSLRDLGLQIGSEVFAVVKATDDALATV